MRIDKQMKRILKNYRRKRRKPCAIGLRNDLSFHLKFLDIHHNGKLTSTSYVDRWFFNSKIRDKKSGKVQ